MYPLGQESDCHSQSLGNVVHRKTCGYEDTKLAAILTAEAYADANAFRKGMQSHYKDDEHDATEISTGEVTDVILLMLLQKSLSAHNEAQAKDTANKSSHRTRNFGSIVRLLKGATLRYEGVTGGNHHTSSDSYEFAEMRGAVNIIRLREDCT